MNPTKQNCPQRRGDPTRNLQPRNVRAKAAASKKCLRRQPQPCPCLMAALPSSPSPSPAQHGIKQQTFAKLNRKPNSNAVSWRPHRQSPVAIRNSPVATSLFVVIRRLQLHFRRKKRPTNLGNLHAAAASAA